MSRMADDEPSPDENVGPGGLALDLSPRTTATPGAATGGSARRRWPWLVVIAVLVGAIGFVISRALTDATQFYLTADEAVARQSELGARSFRLEGTVVEGSTVKTGDGVDFRVSSNGTQVAVHHRGDPPQLFQACIPVVVEGRWQQGAFASTAIIVAHDQQYEEQNSDRMRQAEAAGAESNACAQRDAVAQREAAAR
jgi:cytochrome c-type biogenesis protein CcmE